MTIKRIETITIRLTPEELASEFDAMDADNQAIFFNHVAKLSKKWSGPFAAQMNSVSNSQDLTNSGRSIMKQIGEQA